MKTGVQSIWEPAWCIRGTHPTVLFEELKLKCHGKREMKAPYRVEVRVVEQTGTCIFGHQVGDLAFFDGLGIEGRICWHSLCSMMYKIHGLLHGASYPWLENKNTARHPCPDYKNPVIYEIRRFKTE